MTPTQKIERLLKVCEEKELPLTMVNRPGELAKEFYCTARTEFPKALEALKVARNAVGIVASQATPEEYEEEGGEELDAQCAAEAYEQIVLETRQALTQINSIMCGEGK